MVEIESRERTDDLLVEVLLVFAERGAAIRKERATRLRRNSVGKKRRPMRTGRQAAEVDTAPDEGGAGSVTQPRAAVKPSSTENIHPPSIAAIGGAN